MAKKWYFRRLWNVEAVKLVACIAIKRLGMSSASRKANIGNIEMSIIRWYYEARMKLISRVQSEEFREVNLSEIS